MKNAMVWPLAIACLFAGNVVAADDSDKTQNPCVTFSGDDSHVAERGFQRIRTIDEWAKVWQRHTGQEKVKFKNFEGRYDTFYNPLGLPMIDFDNYMVLAVFQGSGWNCAGLKAVSLKETSDQILFRFADKPYSTAGPDGGGKKVNVYGFFVIPKSGKAIVVEERVFRAKQKQGLADLMISKSELYTTDWKQCFQFKVIK